MPRPSCDSLRSLRLGILSSRLGLALTVCPNGLVGLLLSNPVGLSAGPPKRRRRGQWSSANCIILARTKQLVWMRCALVGVAHVVNFDRQRCTTHVAMSPENCVACVRSSNIINSLNKKNK